VDNDCDGLSDCGRWLEGEIDGAGDVRFVGDSYNTLQGAALVTDLSGDGLPDLVLGSREIDVGRNGGVFVLPSPLPTSGEVQIEPAAWLLNGDDTLNGEMGSALTVADLNFDAEVDLIMSAPGGEADPGRVYVAFGPLSGGLDLSSTGQTTHIIVEGRTAGDGFGQGAVAAQLDQDGQMDLLVTASGVKYTGVTTTYGALFLFLGPLKNDKAASSASQTLRLGSETTPEDLCLVSLGDLSGDGLDELAVGVNSWRVSDGSTKRSLESVLVLDGDLAGASAVEDVARWEVYALDSGDDLGAVILSAGDLDGDGRGELVVGAPNRDIIDTDAGTAWVFDGEQIVRLRGFSAAAEDTAIAEITGDAYTDQRVGAALAAPGDVDQDGRADLLVGAPGLPDYGGAFLLYGPVEGRIQAKDLDTTITAPKVLGADFGEGLGAPGDINGLGHPDLLLYAPETFTWHLLFTDAL
ncbi:integrin alpha, partial [Myxococcota bacterium]|nr:integrin alpha [Myxococcota bacterium]